MTRTTETERRSKCKQVATKPRDTREWWAQNIMKRICSQVTDQVSETYSEIIDSATKAAAKSAEENPGMLAPRLHTPQFRAIVNADGTIRTQRVSIDDALDDASSHARLAPPPK